MKKVKLRKKHFLIIGIILIFGLLIMQIIFFKNTDMVNESEEAVAEDESQKQENEIIEESESKEDIIEKLNADIDNSSLSFENGYDYTEKIISEDESVVLDKANPYNYLSVPTGIYKYDDLYFIVDCYHSQIIYNESLGDDLTSWKVLTDNESSGYSMGHTIAYDGNVLMCDDTENNRVLVFSKNDNGFALSQIFENIGTKPHCIVYDKDTKLFFLLNSYSGEIYMFEYSYEAEKVIVKNAIKSQILSGAYIRTLSIDDEYIYLASGLRVVETSEYEPEIIIFDKLSMDVVDVIRVSDTLAGMVQIEHIFDLFYITTSTDITGSQDAATMIVVENLEDLEKDDYETVYDKWFVGGGTPYFIGAIDGIYYLTEHRLNNHAIWSFTVDSTGQITSANTIY